MKPRIPTTSQNVGTYYNSLVAYNSPLTYNQASTTGAMEFVTRPVATANRRSVATATTSQRSVATSSTKPRTVPTATMKAR